MRALDLCEELYGRERVLEEIEKGIDPITFEQYPTGAEWLLGLRRRINRMIAQKATGKDNK